MRLTQIRFPTFYLFHFIFRSQLVSYWFYFSYKISKALKKKKKTNTYYYIMISIKWDKKFLFHIGLFLTISFFSTCFQKRRISYIYKNNDQRLKFSPITPSHTSLWRCYKLGHHRFPHWLAHDSIINPFSPLFSGNCGLHVIN